MAHIVVGVDGSPVADRALGWAIEEAELHGADVELVHGYVLPVSRAPLSMSNQGAAEQTMNDVVERNAETLQRVKWTTTLAPLLGAPYANALLDAGEEADLIVVGSRGLGGFRELLLGSTSYKVHAPVPVAVVRGGHADDSDGRRRIVVGVDGSRASTRALQWAADEAVVRAVDVTVVHGYFAANAVLLAGTASADQIEANGVVDSVVNAVDLPDGVTVTPQVVAGTSAGAILSLANSDQMVVIGTRGFGGVRRAIVGSTSHQILHHASGPVVVVP